MLLIIAEKVMKQLELPCVVGRGLSNSTKGPSSIIEGGDMETARGYSNIGGGYMYVELLGVCVCERVHYQKRICITIPFLVFS